MNYITLKSNIHDLVGSSTQLRTKLGDAISLFEPFEPYEADDSNAIKNFSDDVRALKVIADLSLLIGNVLNEFCSAIDSAVNHDNPIAADSPPRNIASEVFDSVITKLSPRVPMGYNNHMTISSVLNFLSIQIENNQFPILEDLSPLTKELQAAFDNVTANTQTVLKEALQTISPENLDSNKLNQLLTIGKTIEALVLSFMKEIRNNCFNLEDRFQKLAEYMREVMETPLKPEIVAQFTAMRDEKQTHGSNKLTERIGELDPRVADLDLQDFSRDTGLELSRIRQYFGD